MIIDCHAHIKGGDAGRREFTADHLLRQLDEAGIDKQMVFSIMLASRESNDLTRDRVRGHEDRLIPLCHVIAQEAELALDELDRAIAGWGWKGVKMHWGESAEVITLEMMQPIVERVTELGVPLLLDTVYKADLAMLMVYENPNTTFIVAHWGSPQNPDLMERWARFARVTPNCYLDCSFCHCWWKMPECFEVATCDKVLFGSDGPLWHPLPELMKVRVCHLAPEDEEKVLWRNAVEVFKLEGD